MTKLRNKRAIVENQKIFGLLFLICLNSVTVLKSFIIIIIIIIVTDFVRYYMTYNKMNTVFIHWQGAWIYEEFLTLQYVKVWHMMKLLPIKSILYFYKLHAFFSHLATWFWKKKNVVGLKTT